MTLSVYYYMLQGRSSQLLDINICLVLLHVPLFRFLVREIRHISDPATTQGRWCLAVAVWPLLPLQGGCSLWGRRGLGNVETNGGRSWLSIWLKLDRSWLRCYWRSVCMHNSNIKSLSSQTQPHIARPQATHNFSLLQAEHVTLTYILYAYTNKF